MTKEFQQRWARVSGSELASVRESLSTALTLSGKDTLPGGVARIYATSTLGKEDLLDMAHSIAADEGYWAEMPAENALAATNVRSSILAITGKRQAWQ